MKYFIAALVITSLVASLVPAQNDDSAPELDCAIKWIDMPLPFILSDYAMMSGKKVECVMGVCLTNNIALTWSGSRSNYFVVVEDLLRTNNIGLFQISSNRLVATWIDPTLVTQSKATQRDGGASYVERMRLRREEMKKTKESNQTIEGSP